MIEWLTADVVTQNWKGVLVFVCWVAHVLFWYRRALNAERKLRTCMGFGTYSAATQERGKELTREGFEAALREFQDGVKQEPGE